MKKVAKHLSRYLWCKLNKREFKNVMSLPKPKVRIHIHNGFEVYETVNRTAQWQRRRDYQIEINNITATLININNITASGVH